MVHTIRATRHVMVEFQMLGEEVKDFYVQSLQHGRLESYEPPISEIILRLASSFPDTPWSFADVGANTGIYTLSVAACHPFAHCHAFEPAPSIKDLLLRNISLNPHLKARISCHAVGLSSRSGFAKFYETKNDQGFVSTSSSLHAPKDLPYSEYPVELQRLDDQALEHKVRLLKVDVEGHEFDVLEGGKETIQTHRPVIIFEVLNSSGGPRFNTIASALNYCFFAIIGNSFSCSPTFVSGDQFNYILCPAEQTSNIQRILIDTGLSPL